MFNLKEKGEETISTRFVTFNNDYIDRKFGVKLNEVDSGIVMWVYVWLFHIHSKKIKLLGELRNMRKCTYINHLLCTHF